MAAGALALPAAAPLFGPGLIGTHRYGDSPFLLMRVVALLEGLRVGELLPRWSPDLAYGLGYPFFDFYGPLAFYVASGLHLVGLPIVESIKATQLLAFLLCSLATFGFARRHLGDAGGLVAAAAYGYAPYHLVNAYARGDSLGELTAMGLLPLVLWALEVALAGSLRGGVALALLFGGLILAHNLSALLALPLLAAWGLSAAAVAEQAARRDPLGAPAGGPLRLRSSRGLLIALGGGVLGLALTCFYWLPALWDRRYVHLEHVTTGYFDFRGHFLELARLVQPWLVYDYGLGGTPDGRVPFQLGLAQALLALGGVLTVPWLARRGRPGRFALFAVLVSIGYVVLLSPASRPLWERLPALQVVQFPWRALAGASLGLALTAALPAVALSGRIRAAWGAGAIAGVVLAGSLGANPERWRIPPEDVNVAGVQEYEYLTSAMGSTVRIEYLPTEAKERPWTSWQLVSGEALPRARFPAGAASVRREGIGFVVDTTSAGGGPLVLEHHFFPGWSASLPLSASDPEGFLRVDVPAGTQQVRFDWGETRLRQGARFGSFFALAVLLLAGVAVVFRRGSSAKNGTEAARAQPHAVPHKAAPPWALALAIAATALTLARIPWADIAQPIAAVEPGLNQRFGHEHAPWPYVEPRGHPVGPVRLLGYRQPAVTLAGTTHVVDLRAGGSADATARVVAPAETILNAPRAIAEAAVRLDGDGATLRLDVPAAAPPGLYQVEIAVSGERRVLAPFRVLPPSQMQQPGAALARFGDQLALEAIELIDPRADRPGLRLRWRALRAIDRDWRFSLRLVDEQGNLWGAQDGRPADGFYPAYLWRDAAVVEERRDVISLAGTPPGPYRLEVRVYSLAGRTLDVLDARGAAVAPLYRSDPIALLPAPAPLVVKSGGPPIALVESNVGARVADAGARLPVSVLFRADETPGRDLDVVLRLGTTETRVPFGFSASEWRPGEVVRIQHGLLVRPELAAGQHQLSVSLVDRAGQVAFGPADLGEIEVRNRPRRFDLPTPRVAVGAVFDGAIELVGFDAETRARAGGTVPVKLWWRGRAPVEISYTVFVHLLDAERRVRGQVDRVPMFPTSGWAVGEVIEDRYEVPIDPTALPGTYVIEVGLYDAVSGQRLRVDAGGDQIDLVKVGVE